MASGDCVMEQMVLRAQEQPCRCWRGNRPSGGYCFPFFSPSVLYSSFSVLRTPRIDSELCSSELCSRLSPPGRLPDRSSLSDLRMNKALVLLRVVSATPLPLGPLCVWGASQSSAPSTPDSAAPPDKGLPTFPLSPRRLPGS